MRGCEKDRFELLLLFDGVAAVPETDDATETGMDGSWAGGFGVCEEEGVDARVFVGAVSIVMSPSSSRCREVAGARSVIVWIGGGVDGGGGGGGVVAM